MGSNVGVAQMYHKMYQGCRDYGDVECEHFKGEQKALRYANARNMTQRY